MVVAARADNSQKSKMKRTKEQEGVEWDKGQSVPDSVHDRESKPEDGEYNRVIRWSCYVSIAPSRTRPQD